MTPGTLRVAKGSLSEGLAVGVGELAHDPARNACDQHPSWQLRTRQHDRSGGDEGTCADSGTTEDNRPDTDQRAGFHVRTVHGGVVAKADPVFQHGWLTGIDVQAA
jgi:hypothetical protein